MRFDHLVADCPAQSAVRVRVQIADAGGKWIESDRQAPTGFVKSTMPISTGTAITVHRRQNQRRYMPPPTAAPHMLRDSAASSAMLTSAATPISHPVSHLGRGSVEKKTSAAITRSAIIISPLKVIQ